MKIKKTDTFWVDITLRHESCDSQKITEAIGLTPLFVVEAGEEVGTITRRSTVWMAHFQEGIGDEEWARTLKDLLLFSFSLLKRGIVGSWHKVSAKHLPAYREEMTFRFNRRGRADLFLDTLRHMVTADPLAFEALTA